MGVGRSAKYSAKHRTTSRTHSARLLSKRGDNIPLTFSRGKESAFSQSRARQNDVESAACTPRRLHWYYVHIISGTFSFSLGFVFSGNVPRGNRLTSVKKIGVSFFPNRKGSRWTRATARTAISAKMFQFDGSPQQRKHPILLEIRVRFYNIFLLCTALRLRIETKHSELDLKKNIRCWKRVNQHFSIWLHSSGKLAKKIDDD